MNPDLKSYPTPWQGTLILACRKCQKKLKKNDGLKPLANLKKTIKRHNKRHPQTPLHLINIPCMDLCPKNAVTICLPAQSETGLHLLRHEEDLLNSLAPRSSPAQG